jgi:hypothetical protein
MSCLVTSEPLSQNSISCRSFVRDHATSPNKVGHLLDLLPGGFLGASETTHFLVFVSPRTAACVCRRYRGIGHPSGPSGQDSIKRSGSDCVSRRLYSVKSGLRGMIISIRWPRKEFLSRIHEALQEGAFVNIYENVRVRQASRFPLYRSNSCSTILRYCWIPS